MHISVVSPALGFPGHGQCRIYHRASWACARAQGPRSRGAQNHESKTEKRKRKERRIKIGSLKEGSKDFFTPFVLVSSVHGTIHEHFQRRGQWGGGGAVEIDRNHETFGLPCGTPKLESPSFLADKKCIELSFIIL